MGHAIPDCLELVDCKADEAQVACKEAILAKLLWRERYPLECLRRSMGRTHRQPERGGGFTLWRAVFTAGKQKVAGTFMCSPARRISAGRHPAVFSSIAV